MSSFRVRRFKPKSRGAAIPATSAATTITQGEKRRAATSVENIDTRKKNDSAFTSLSSKYDLIKKYLTNETSASLMNSYLSRGLDYSYKGSGIIISGGNYTTRKNAMTWTESIARSKGCKIISVEELYKTVFSDSSACPMICDRNQGLVANMDYLQPSDIEVVFGGIDKFISFVHNAKLLYPHLCFLFTTSKLQDIADAYPILTTGELFFTIHF